MQLRIMQVLWDRGPSTAREITEEFSRAKPIALSAVQTLLRQMEAKGAVTHDVEDRTFIVRPLFQESEVAGSAARDLLSPVLGGSVYGLVAHLLERPRSFAHFVYHVYADHADVSLEVHAGKGDVQETHRVFDLLHASREEVEAAFGAALVWDRHPESDVPFVRFRLPAARWRTRSGGRRSSGRCW